MLAAVIGFVVLGLGLVWAMCAVAAEADRRAEAMQQALHCERATRKRSGSS